MRLSLHILIFVFSLLAMMPAASDYASFITGAVEYAGNEMPSLLAEPDNFVEQKTVSLQYVSTDENAGLDLQANAPRPLAADFWRPPMA